MMNTLRGWVRAVLRLALLFNGAVLLLLIWVLLLLGCVATSPSLDASPKRGFAELFIDNRSWQDIRVYAMHSSTHIAQVSSMERKRVVLKKKHINPSGGLQLFVRFLPRTQSWESDEIMINAGQSVEFVVTSPVTFSHWSMPRR